MRESKARLSQLETLWSQVRLAHQGPDEARAAAQARLLERYARPAYRYLLGALHDPEAAGDLAQEFAVRFLKGDFHRADQQCGRFRDYVKKALSHLVARHFRRRLDAGPLPDDLEAPAAAPAGLEAADREFLRAWREELLNRAWAALARVEEETGRPVYLVLRLAFDHPELRSPQRAAELGARLGRPVTAVAERQALHRAREKFAELLLDEVAQTLDEPGADRLTEELIHLDLLRYCGPALEGAARR
jgi:RNA polymerase sigma-70 factor (ECF subfamily)